jgi:hypothetical protein
VRINHSNKTAPLTGSTESTVEGAITSPGITPRNWGRCGHVRQALDSGAFVRAAHTRQALDSRCAAIVALVLRLAPPALLNAVTPCIEPQAVPGEGRQLMHLRQGLRVEHAVRIVLVDDTHDDDVVQVHPLLHLVVEDTDGLVLGQHVLRVGVDLDGRQEVQPLADRTQPRRAVQSSQRGQPRTQSHRQRQRHHQQRHQAVVLQREIRNGTS